VGAAGVDAQTGHGRVDAMTAIAAAMGPAPETSFASTPPSITRSAALAYSIEPVGASRYRVRVDGGQWSAASAAGRMSLTLAEGRHTVEAQAVADNGAVDLSPAIHQVAVDLTAPRLDFTWRRQGANAILFADAEDALGGVDPASFVWRFVGRTARGAKVTVPLRLAVQPIELIAKDRAGNEAAFTQVLGVTAGAATPRRAVVTRLTLPRSVSRRAGGLVVTGRLAARGYASVTLRRASGTSHTISPRGATAPRAGVAFRVTLPVRRLAPGRYTVVVTGTTAQGMPLGKAVRRPLDLTR
jgi:hypothetical protein